MSSTVYESKQEGVKIVQVYKSFSLNEPVTVTVEVSGKYNDPALPDEMWQKIETIGKRRVYQFSIKDMNYPCIALKNYILLDQMSQAAFISLANSLYHLIARLASMNLYLDNPKIEDFVVVVSRSGVDTSTQLYLANPHTIKRQRNRQTGILQRMFKSRSPLLSEMETGFYFLNDLRKLYTGVNTPFLIGTNLGNVCGTNMPADELLKCLDKMTQQWAFYNMPRVLRLKPEYLKAIWKGIKFVTKPILLLLSAIDSVGNSLIWKGVGALGNGGGNGKKIKKPISTPIDFDEFNQQFN